MRGLFRRSIAVLAVLAAGMSWVTMLAIPASAIGAPVAFSAAALPTWQTNGEVYALASAQGLVFAAGNFTRIRPPGQPDLITTTNPDGTTTTAPNPLDLNRQNFAVFDAATGEPTNCTADVTIPSPPTPDPTTVRSLNVSPDGQTLYIGGYFTSIAGQPRQHVAAMNISTCSINAWHPTPSGFVRAIVSTATTVYIGGGFGSVNGEHHLRLAALNAVQQPNAGKPIPTFTASLDGDIITTLQGNLIDPDVDALALKPDNSVLVVGGWFETVNGAASNALAVVDATTGATVKAFPGLIPKPGFTNSGAVNTLAYGSAVKTIVVDNTGFYTGNEGTGTYIFDGRMAIDWGTYALRWRDGCLGATQALVPYHGLLYVASHAHDCSNVGAYGDGQRRHFLAETLTAGANGKPSFAGWFPDTNDGINESIGPRALAVATSGSTDYLWSGGEFTSVNNVAQQGLTRFGHSLTIGPLSGPNVEATSTIAGQIRLAWRSSLDYDDATLTYNVYRDGGSTPVYTTTSFSVPWDRPQVTWIDNQTPGSTHTYQVSVTDGTNTQTGSVATATVANTSSAYEQRIVSDGANFLLRYDESSGSFIEDASGNNNNFLLNGAATYQQTGALPNDPSHSLGFSGNQNYAVSENRFTAPTTLTLETWFKTNTTLGGRLIDFASSQTKDSSDFDSRSDDAHMDDKTIYMTTSGQLIFGTEGVPGNYQTLLSPQAYNNNVWHYVVATQDANGMSLFVDGARVARNSVTTNGVETGFWRVGGDTLKGWPSNPGDGYFLGSLDETAEYQRALSPTEVAEHFSVGGGAFKAGPTDPYGRDVFDDQPLFQWRLNDATGSTQAADTTGAANKGVFAGSVTFQQPSAIAGVTGTDARSVKFDGSSGQVHSLISSAADSTFSVESWVKTASATGGEIAGFGSAPTGDSATQDRKVWFRNDGRISFGVRQGSAYYVITSPNAYNDNTWHDVTATRSLGTMTLYVDGQPVATQDQVANQSYTGYWRFGGDSFTGWSGAPTSKYLNGFFDELAVYPNVLTANQVAEHYSAGNPLVPDVAPPTQPANLSVGLTGPNATLTWRASADNVGVTGYEVHRSATPDFTPSAADLLTTVTTTTYTDASIPLGQWYYRVVAVDAAGNKTPSSQVSLFVSDVTPPTVPGSVVAVGGAQTASLSWNASTDNVELAQYLVYRSPTSGFTPSAATFISTTQATSYSDVPPGNQTWYYRIVAQDTAGNVSSPSAQVSALISDTQPPTDPTDLSATTSGGDTVNLTWPASSDNATVAGYDVYRSTTTGFTPSPSTLLKTVSTNAATDKPGLGVWYYRVIAKDAVGNASGPSPEAKAYVATVVTVTPTADTWANAGATTQNNGTTLSLVSRGTTGAIPYMRFVLPPVPAGTRLTSAVLRLHTTTQGACGGCTTPGSTDTQTVRFADDSWAESTLTWANKPAFNGPNLGTLGATIDNTSYDTTLDVSQMQAVTGAEITLALQSTGTDNLYLYSKDFTTASSRPQLLLSFAPQGFDPLAPTQPIGLDATRTAGTVHLTWTPSTDDQGAPHYDVYRSPTPSFVPSATTKIGTTNTPALDDTPGIGDWYYKLIAGDAQGHLSPPSDEFHITVPDFTPPSTPTGVTAQANGPSVSVNWNASTDNIGVQSYTVYRGASANFTPGTPIGTVTGTSYTDTVSAGVYYYKVIAADAVGNASAASSAALANVVDSVAPSQPTGLGGQQSGQGATLSWTGSTDAFGVTGYQVYRSTTADFTPSASNLIDTVTDTSYGDDNPPVGQVYYKVEAVDPSGNSSNPSNQLALTINDVTAPTAPTTFTATLVPHETVQLDWSGATDNVGVQSYTIYRGTTDGFTPSLGNVLTTTANTTYNDHAGPGNWYYLVVANDAAGLTSPPTSQASALIPDSTPPSVPSGLSATGSGAAVGLSWTGSTDDIAVLGYEVHRSTLAGFTPSTSTLVKTISGTSFTDHPGAGTWYYRIVAVDTSGNTSSGSNQSSATLVDNDPPTVPTQVTATQTNQPVDVTWNASQDLFGVASYRIYRSAASNFTPSAGTLVGTSTDASYKDSNVAYGTWYYRVIAVDSNGHASDPSALASVTVGDRTAPTAPSVNVTGNGATLSLSWNGATDDASGVAGYEVYRSNVSGFTPDASTLVTPAQLATTSFSDQPGPGTWFYRVVSIDGAGNHSAGSVQASGTVPDTLPPTSPTDLTVVQNGAAADLDWTAATDNLGVTLYDIHRSATPGFNPSALTYVGSTTNTTYSDNAPAGTWFYRVVARDAAGHTTPSDDESVTMVDSTAPSAPGAPQANVNNRSVNVSWNASTDDFGVQNYSVYRSANPGLTPSQANFLAQVSGTSYTDSSPGAGTWYYRVVASDPSGLASNPSNEVNATINDIAPPTAPTVVASATGGAINLTWSGATDDVGVASYGVYRSSTAGFTPAIGNLIGTTIGQSFADTPPGPGTWYYSVVALDAAANASNPSTIVSAVAADVSAPVAPASLTATASTTTVALSWAAATDNVGVAKYEVHRSKFANFTPTSATRRAVVTTGTTYTDTPPIGSWYYEIVAVDAAGNASPPSPQATAKIWGAATTTSLTPTADTYVNQGATGTNYGSATQLQVRGGTTAASISFLRYVFPTAPAGKQLTGAVLKFKTSSDGTAASTDAPTIKIGPDSWVESTLKWNNKPAITGATVGTITGAKAINTAYSATLDATAIAGLLGHQATLTVQGNNTDNLMFWSRNYGTVAARPTLVLTWQQTNSDTDGPLQVTGGAANVSGTSVGLTWNPGVDDTGVTSYDVHRSNTATFTPSTTTKIANVTGTSYTDPAPGVGTWYYKVIAKDALSQASLPSDPITATIPDITAPGTAGTPTALVNHQTVTLTWTAATDNIGVTGYDVYRSATNGFTPAPGLKIPSVNGLSTTDQPGAGVWYYRVVAKDAAGNAGTASAQSAAVTVADEAPPTQPGTPAGTASGRNVALTWSAATDNVAVTAYNIYRSSNATFTPSGANLVGTTPEATAAYTDMNPGAGKWYYRVIAVDAAGNASAASVSGPGVVPDIDAPGTPGTPAGSVSHQAVTLTWTAASDNLGVIRYVLYRSSTAGFTPSEATKVAAVASPSALDQPSAGTWYYRVVAEDAAGNAGSPSAQSAAIAVSDESAPSQPGTPAVSTSGLDVSISWDASTDNVGVAGYRVYRSASGGSGVLLDTVSNPNYVDHNPGAGTWYYRVVAFDTAGNNSPVSLPGHTGVADTSSPSTVANLAATVDHGLVSLSWDAATDNVGVTEYDVYRSADDGFTPSSGNQIDTVTGPSTTDQPGIGTWYYVVIAKDGAGNAGGASTQESASVLDESAPTQPGAPSATVVGHDVSLTWTGSTDNVAVAGYRIYRSANSAFTAPALLGSTDNSTLQFTDVNPGVATWYYRIVAFDGAGNTTASDQTQVNLLDSDPPTTVTDLSATADDQTVTLNWTAANDNVGVTQYDLYRSRTAGFTPASSNKFDSVSGNSDTDQPGGGTWYYLVIAKDAAGNPSAVSNQASTVVADHTPPTKPGTPSGSTTTQDVSLTWTASTDDVGVIGYRIYRSNTSSFPLDGTTYLDTTPDATPAYDDAHPGAGTWYYEVVGFDAANNTSTPSDAGQGVVADIDGPSAVTGLGASVDHQTVSLSWDASSDNVGVTGYNVYRSEDSGFTPSPSNLVKPVSGTSTTDEPGGGIWYYQVLATDAAHNLSPESDETSADVTDETAPSQPGTPSATADGQNVDLSWAAATDDVAVTGYKIYRSATSGAAVADMHLVDTVDGSTLATTDSNPGAGTWYYVVVAFDAVDHASTPSGEGHATVADIDPPSQVANVQESVDHQTVTLTWDEATDNVGVAGYNVYRSAHSDFTGESQVGSTVTGLSTTDQPGGGTWYYRVVALDTATNASTPSDAVTAAVDDETAPTQPGTPSATANGRNVDLSWAAATDDVAVTSYKVYRSATSGAAVADMDLVDTVDGSTLVLTDTNPGAGTWYYVVVAFDAVDHASTPSGEGHATVADIDAPAKVANVQESVDHQTVSLTWDASSDNVAVSGYDVYRSAHSDFTGESQVGSTVTGLSTTDQPGGGTWYYRVVAVDAATNASTPSDGVTAVVADETGPTKPGTPSGLASGHDVSLSWTASTDDVGVVGYHVYRSASSSFTPGGSTFVGDTANASPAFTEHNVPAGTWYYIVVGFDGVPNDGTASDAGQVGVADGDPPSQVANVQESVDHQTVTLTWDEATDNVGVVGYKVFRSAHSDFTGQSQAGATVTGLSTTDQPGGGTWYYRVVAVDAATNASTPSDGVTAVVADETAPSQPGAPSGSASGHDVSLSWTASTDDVGVVGYHVYRSSSSALPLDGWTFVGDTTDHSPAYTEHNVPSGTWYYRVLAYDAAPNVSTVSDAGQVGVADNDAPSQVLNLHSSVTHQTVSLSWDASSDNVGVTGYNVYRSNNSGFAPSAGNKVDTVAGTSDTDQPGPGTWYYIVLAKDAAGNLSNVSDPAGATVDDETAPSQPGSVSATANGRDVLVSWNASTDDVGVNAYRVYRSATSGFTPDNNSLVTATNGSATSYTDTNPGAGTWYYRVIAVDAAANASTASSQAQVAVADQDPPSAPGNTTTSLNELTVTISWSASTDNVGVTGYNLYRSRTDGFTPGPASKVGGTITGTSTTDQPASGTWFYKVIAVDAAGNPSQPSGQASVVVPTFVSVSPTADSFVNASATSTNYGADDQLQSRGNTGLQSYLRFTIPTAPAGQSLVGAVLRVHTSTDANAGSANSHEVRIGNDNWVESTVNWTNRPAISGALLGTISGASAVNTSYDVPLSTSVVGGLLGTQQTFGIKPASASDTDSLYLWSQHFGTAASRPQLLLFWGTPTDSTAPTAPTGLATTVNKPDISLSWNAATDDNAVTGYSVYRSTTSGFTPGPGNLLAVTGDTNTTYLDSNPGGGTYYYRVLARDAAGNLSPSSNEASGAITTVVTLNPTADTFANAGAPTTNYAANSMLQSRGTSGLQSFLRFVLPNAPAGQTLTGAVLRVHTSTDANAASADSHTVQVADDNWTETAVTWNNKPAINGAVLGTITGATSINASYDTTLSVAQLAALLGSEQTFGVSSTGTDSLYLWSNNFTTAAQRPTLILTFS